MINPSRWSRRLLIAFIAFIGASIAFYLGLYQLGMITKVWDPIFGQESQAVLDSEVSRWIREKLYIPDALLGSLAYLGDFVFAFLGSNQRWKTHPWIVILFGINVYPVGIVSLILVTLQATVVKEWCLLCLLSASVSIILMFLAYDEVRSAIKRLRKP